MTGTIFDIEHGSFVDGPGIRTTVFFKGCNLRCAWCHNPEGLSRHRQMMFYKDNCSGCGKCKDVCPYNLEKCDFCRKCEIYCPNDARKIYGKEYEVDEVFAEIVRDKNFYENSGGGVTFSGGECMLQINFLCKILKKCKENGVHTAVDTAGHIPFESFEKVIPFTDLFLYDIKSMDTDVHKKYTGVGNELILENLSILLKMNLPVWIKVPIIPTVNDNTEEMQKIKEFISKYGKAQKIELLPYHKMGENKYNALGMKAHEFSAPEEGKMKLLKSVFSD